jgi:hypothetical protein
MHQCTTVARLQVPVCDSAQAKRDYQDLLRECDGLVCEGQCLQLFRARFLGCLRGFEPFFEPEVPRGVFYATWQVSVALLHVPCQDRGKDADGDQLQRIVHTCVEKIFGPPKLPKRSVHVRLGILLSTCVPQLRTPCNEPWAARTLFSQL